MTTGKLTLDLSKTEAPESSGFLVGDCVEVLKVGTPLPKSLIGSFGTISNLIYLESSQTWIVQVKLPQGSYTLSVDCVAWRRPIVSEPETVKLGTGARLWLEAKMRHYERIIFRLIGKPQHQRLVQLMQAEYEQVLSILGINDEEVEF